MSHDRRAASPGPEARGLALEAGGSSVPPTARGPRLWRSLSSLRSRLLLLACLGTFPALLFSCVVAGSERRAVLQRAEEDALHLADLTSREHGHQIDGARRLMAWLGEKLSREGARSQVLTDPGFLEALLAGHPQVANLGVLSPEGRVLRSAYPPPDDSTWVDNPAFLAALSSRTVEAGSYVVSPILGVPTLNHALAVRDASGTVTAVVFSGLDLRWLSAVSRGHLLPGECFVLLADRQGRVLARVEGGEAGLPPADGTVVPELVGLAGTRSGQLVAWSPSVAPRYLVAAPLVGSPGVVVAVGVPYERIQQEAAAAFTKALVVLCLLTAFTIAAVLLAAELGLLRALRSLAGAARRLGAGDMGARAPQPSSDDEIGSLARAFNAMAEALTARHAEALKAQVELRSLASRLHVAREAEAARLSREMHDQIGQTLTALKLDLTRLVRHCPAEAGDGGCRAGLAAEVHALAREIDAAVDVVRRLATHLRPGVLDRLGLVAALEGLAREAEERAGLTVTVETRGDLPALAEATSVSLFRIAQESLTNVVRHAEAHTVSIRVAATGDGLLTLEVSDDGRGLPDDRANDRRSLGILGMRERALLCGGTLTIGPQAEGGTVVRAAVPVVEPPSEPSVARPPG